MNERDDTPVSFEAIKRRLGVAATGARRDIRAVVAAAEGERLEAVVVAIWKRHGWVALATDAGLHLARHPIVLGRGRTYSFRWEQLTAFEAGPLKVTLDFGAERITLTASGPHEEFVRLIEAARRVLHGTERDSVDELRALAKTKLGRFLTFGFESTIDALPDRLEPGEHVERMAGASLGFAGLLVLTNRRLLLLEVALRRVNDREWSCLRDDVADVEVSEDGLLLRLRGDEEALLGGFLPPERRDEFAAVLDRPTTTQPH